MSGLDYSILLGLNGSDNIVLDSMVLLLTNAYTWIPLYLFLIFLVIHNNEKWSQIFLVTFAGVCCVLVSSAVSELMFKPWVARLRPIHTEDLAGSLDLIEGFNARGYSFFSSHAANTFSLAVFMSLLVRRWTFTIAMVAWSLVNCWTRLYLGAHFPSDIIAGLLCGGVVGWLVYMIHMHYYMQVTSRLHFISSQYTKSGYSLNDIDMFLNLLMVMVVVIIILSILNAQRWI